MRVAVIGCGNMGAGIACKLAVTNKMYLYDHNYEKMHSLEQHGYGIACKDVKETLRQGEIVVLAIKPQNLAESANSIKKALKKEQIMVSLLAGTPLAALQNLFPKVYHVRMMPNLPLIYGAGVIGLSADEKLSQSNREQLTKSFEPLGTIYWLPEKKIDALSVLTGSGPAFVLVMIEAMIDAGVAMGFSATDAQKLVSQMMHGSLTLLAESKKNPTELKWQIASPGGTTISGLRILEQLALRGSIIDTFLATFDRAKELSSMWQE